MDTERTSVLAGLRNLTLSFPGIYQHKNMMRVAVEVRKTWVLFLLIFSFHSLVSSCNVPERLQRRMETVSPGDQNEIGVAVNEDNDMKIALGTILNEFTAVGARRPKLECMTGMNDTLQRVGEVVQNLGLPKFDGCMSRIDSKNGKEERIKSKELSMALDRFESGLAAKGANAIRSINPSIIDNRKGFGKPVEVGDIPWQKPDNYYSCSIHHANAYRVDNRWNYIAELTNEVSTKNVGARERYFYREMFQLSKDNVVLVQESRLSTFYLRT